MAKGKFIKILEILRGKAAGLVVRCRPDGTFIFSAPPTYKKGSGTPAQKAHWKHVSQVGPYASALAKTHPIYARLAAEPEAKERWLSAYNFAFADCMKPPVIHCIERREGRIRVEATDNIGVTRVRVFVLDEAGTSLDDGDATLAEGNWWEFPAHADGRTILAQAWDLPGNMVEMVL